MRALRIRLNQTSANYRKEETMLNKMTYPLPPISTVIGALHKACGYTEYHPMDISIQGKYGAIGREMHITSEFLNSVNKDRGVLVYFPSNKSISEGYIKVATVKKGGDFEKGVGIIVHNNELLEMYKTLRKELSLKSTCKKYVDKKDEKYNLYVEEIRHIKESLSHFRTMNKKPVHYEILYELELTFHVRADKQVLNDIYEHIYDLKAIGRSEDFVHVLDVQFVELTQDTNIRYINNNSAYLNMQDVKKKNILNSDNNYIVGTKYYLNKNYKFSGKNGMLREFNRIQVVYTSEYKISKYSENLYFDVNSNEIVNFV